METCTEYYCTILENRTTNCNLGNGTANCTDFGSVLYENLGILTSKQLSRITNSDFNSINSSTFSTGNTPKDLIIDQYYMADHMDAESKIDSRKRKRNSISDSPPNRNLTPVTIMVADSIGAVRSRRLLKVLLDSGSTTTLINKKCLPKKCKPCQISQSRMVNTLAGSYQSSAIVVMRNLRLPELDKNINVEQQKALVFESDTCRYDVILGADFLTKHGIDVEYSTGTIDWLKNELALCDPRNLKDKDFEAMAEIIEIQQEVDFFGVDWCDPTCFAIEILDAKYEKA